MNDEHKGCACTDCPGAGCTCGCQDTQASAAAAMPTGCQCGCRQGKTCGCASREAVALR